MGRGLYMPVIQHLEDAGKVDQKIKAIHGGGRLLRQALATREPILKNAKSLAWACTLVTLTFGDWSRMIMTFVSTWAERSGFLSSVPLHEWVILLSSDDETKHTHLSTVTHQWVGKNLHEDLTPRTLAPEGSLDTGAIWQQQYPGSPEVRHTARNIASSGTQNAGARVQRPSEVVEQSKAQK